MPEDLRHVLWKEVTNMTKKQKKVLWRIIATAVLVAVVKIFSIGGVAGTVLYLAAYLIIGYDILRKAFRGIIKGQVFDENFLMAVATVGAIALAVYEKSGDYLEAVAVMLFYQIGELFQSYAVGKSRRSITALMDIRPDYANIEQDGKLVQVDPDDVSVGSIIVVQPGEKIPLDGVVTEGSSTLNTAALTGESLPRDAAVGDEVISGCVNMTGVLKIRTTKAFGESTVSKILELVENSSSHKSRSENFISKFARIYTPAVCIGALVLAVLPPVVRLVMGLSGDWGTWVYRALTFLVISCPCALVISIPLSFFAGLGGASRAGVLVKGSNYLETLSKTRVVVFDKTGTLTQGVFDVTGVHHNTMPQKKVLEYAALAECASSHPISKSLQRAYGGEIDRHRVTDVQEISGNGITAKVDGTDVAVGRSYGMQLNGAEIVIECLKEQGVDTVFGYPGGAILNVYDELYKHRDEIRHILTSHEQGASHAADGYARATGKVGVCLATSGPGATNLVTGIATAYMDSIPIVAITCNVGVSLLGKDSFQEIDIAGITMPITKYSFIVKDVTKLADTIRKAFRIAKTGRPGPVLVDIPKDITAKVTEYIPEELGKCTKEDSSRKTPRMDEQRFDRVISMLEEAEKPFVFVGGGAVLSGASQELKEFVDKLDAPVTDSLMGKGAFPGTDPRYTGMLGMHGTKASNFGVSECDLLVVMGARFSDRVTGNTEKFAKNAKIIQLDIDPVEINKNVLITEEIIGDLKDVLKTLNKRLKQQNHAEWLEKIQGYKEKYPLKYHPNVLSGPFLVEEIYRQTNGEALIVTEVGQHQLLYCRSRRR